MENTTALVSLLCALFTAYTGSPAAVSAANSRGDFSISDWACIPCLPVLCIAGDGTLSVDPNGCWEKDARLVQLQDFVRGYNSTH